MPNTRRLASRTVAKASGNTELNASPFAKRCLNSSVLPCNSASESCSKLGSNLLILATTLRKRFKVRSLLEPKIEVNNFESIKFP